MGAEKLTNVEGGAAEKWERALELFDPNPGLEDHVRLTITLPRYLYRYSTLSERRAPHTFRVFIDYTGRTLELTAVISEAAQATGIEIIEFAPTHFVNRMPLSLGVRDAREVVAMLMRNFRPEALEIRTI